MSGELPLTNDPASKYVPWTIGLMMYLSSLAVFVFIISFQIMGSLSQSSTSRFLLIFPSSTPMEETQTTLTWLQEQPHLTRLSLLFGDTDSGPESSSVEEGSPLFVEIETSPLPEEDLSNFLKSLPRLSSTVHIIPQKSSLSFSPFTTFSFEIFIVFLAAAFILTPFITVSFASTTSFLIHKNIIVLLSLLGASDAQIARQFQKNAQNLSLRGGLLSYALLIMTLGLGCLAFYGTDCPFIIDHFSLIALTFFSLFLIPPFLGLVISLATRWTVMKQLSLTDY